MKQSAINPKKLIKIIAWCILGAIALFVIIVLATLLVQKYVKKSPVPMFAGRAYLIVASGSMSPTIDKGDLIIIKKSDEYVVHDIITFVEDDGKVVTHRIISIVDGEGTFITKGDFNDDYDQLDSATPPIRLDQVQGKVVGTIPKVGVFYDWLLHDGGWIYAMSLLIVVFVGIYLWGRIKSDSEPEANKAESSADEPQADSNDTAQVCEATAENSADSPADTAQPKEENDVTTDNR